MVNGTYMENYEVKQLVDDIFNKIMNVESISGLSEIISQNEVMQRNQVNGEAYPYLKWTLTLNEISNLKEKGILDKEGVLTGSLGGNKLTPLEKLLYSIIWKNGDLGKERHIVEGIESINKSEVNLKKDGLVFFQFGKHLADRKEPIIDQHVLRAFGIYSCKDNDFAQIKKYREKDVIGAEDIELIEMYKKWLISEKLKDTLRNEESYTFYIDKVLFSLGKTVKIKKSKRTRPNKNSIPTSPPATS